MEHTLVCVYTSKCAYVCVLCTRVHACVCAYAWLYMWMCISDFLYACVYTYVYVFMCMVLCTCTCKAHFTDASHPSFILLHALKVRPDRLAQACEGLCVTISPTMNLIAGSGNFMALPGTGRAYSCPLPMEPCLTCSSKLKLLRPALPTSAQWKRPHGIVSWSFL